ncbi:hypothetical protein Tco_1006340 [Tanacetum coccineum]|uniref:Uncharacterized protein n=1 Tax=Tanacetum coccineum TaxID=301880 RepID=A0ABQ5FHP7_9ASTR
MKMNWFCLPSALWKQSIPLFESVAAAVAAVAAAAAVVAAAATVVGHGGGYCCCYGGTTTAGGGTTAVGGGCYCRGGDSILSSQAHTLLSSQPPPHSPPPRSIATRWSDMIKLLSARVKEEMWCCEHHTNLTVMNLRKTECSNCKFLAEKIKTLEAKIKILEGALEMKRHPEKHTLESAAILHELYNDMGKLGLE